MESESSQTSLTCWGKTIPEHPASHPTSSRQVSLEAGKDIKLTSDYLLTQPCLPCTSTRKDLVCPVEIAFASPVKEFMVISNNSHTASALKSIDK